MTDDATSEPTAPEAAPEETPAEEATEDAKAPERPAGQPFFQRSVNARAIAHEELKKAEAKVEKWFTTRDQA